MDTPTPGRAFDREAALKITDTAVALSRFFYERKMTNQEMIGTIATFFASVAHADQVDPQIILMKLIEFTAQLHTGMAQKPAFIESLRASRSGQLLADKPA